MEPGESGNQGQVPAPASATPTQVAQPAVPQAPAAAPQYDPVRDRTREQFEKLLDSNQRLFEQNELLRKEMQERLTPPATPQPAPTPTPQVQTQTQGAPEYEFYEKDPTTGELFINRDKLNSYMKDIQEKANRAEKTVQTYIKTTEDREIERQNKEAWQAYPELDPTQKEKFSDQFYKQVRGVLYDSMLNATDYGGRPLTYKEAADFVKGTPASASTAPVVPASPADNAGAALKEASAAHVTSQHQDTMNMSDTDELRRLQLATRMGNSEALAKRLIYTEHILPKDAQQV